MELAQGAGERRSVSALRVQNLLLVAQVRVGWPKSDEFQRAVRELRTAYPTGSAIMNFVAGQHGNGVRAAWLRLASVFLVASRIEDARHTHLGTVHLVEPVGPRAIPMRLTLRLLERRGGDFAKHGDKIVTSADDAADWLAARLASGPITWTRGDLRDIIATFIRDNPLPVHGPGSRPWR